MSLCLPIACELLPGVSKLVSVAKYRHFDFGMSFGTALKACIGCLEVGERSVPKTKVLVHAIEHVVGLALARRG